MDKVFKIRRSECVDRGRVGQGTPSLMTFEDLVLIVEQCWAVNVKVSRLDAVDAMHNADALEGKSLFASRSSPNLQCQRRCVLLRLIRSRVDSKIR